MYDGAQGADGAGPDEHERLALVQHLCEQGRFAEAQAMLDDAWVRRVGSLGHLLRAYVYALQGRPAASREAVDWALLHLPGEKVDLLCLAGQVLLALGDEHRAVAVAQRATIAAPFDWRPRVLLADAYRELDRIGASVAVARHAVALAPDEVETHLTLARSLDLRPALPGPRRREEAAERDLARSRAAALGADDAQLAGTRAPWWRRLRWLPALVIFLGLQLVAGIDWRLGLAALAAMMLALVGLWVVGTRRTGARPVERVQAARAAAHAELAAEPERIRRATEAMVLVPLPLVPLFTTGFAAAAYADDRPWPLVCTVATGLAAAATAYALAVLVRWWYGDEALHGLLWRSPAVERRLLALLLLSGGTVALALGGVGGGGWWHALFLAHVLWFLVGLALGLWHLVRERGHRARG